MNRQDFLHYWGKTSKNDNGDISYHLLPYHCLDVAACGYHMVKNNLFNIKKVCPIVIRMKRIHCIGLPGSLLAMILVNLPAVFKI